MATYDDIIARIADDVMRSDINSQIGAGINRAIRHYQGERTWFNESSSTFSTVTAQESYSTADGLPSDILKLDLVKIVYNSGEFPLFRQQFSTLESWQFDRTAGVGTPTDYAEYAGSVYLYPIPDQAYEVKLWYQKEYSALASGGSNDWTNEPEALNLIEARTGWWVATRILRDVELGSIYKSEEMQALSAMKKRSHKFTSSGKVKRFF
jgi:hypothetical protein